MVEIWSMIVSLLPYQLIQICILSLLSLQTILSTSKELIQLDPPELRYPFLPNRSASMVCLLKIVNVTDHTIRFSTWVHDDNSALYQIEPAAGLLPPRSTEAIKVKRTAQKKEPKDMQCKDKVGVLSGIVTEGVEVGDISWNEYQKDIELPIVLTKVRLLNIQFIGSKRRFTFCIFPPPSLQNLQMFQ
jgi:hypothetical protein